jgi:aquaporin Z
MGSLRKYAAEAYGTFVLVGLGTAAIIAAVAGAGDAIGISLAFGLALLVGLFTVGHISGGHFNPAVSLAMYLDRRLALGDMVAYWVSQAVGAVLASLTLAWIIGKDAVATTVSVVNEAAVSTAGGYVTEAILTTVFVLVILVVTRAASSATFFVIALALTSVHLAGIPLTGASVNPARSLAPALVAGEWANFGVYVVGPLVGAVVAFVLYRGLVARDQR